MKYEASVIKGMLFGLESDLKLDRYMIANSSDIRNENASRYFEATRDSAMEEARSMVLDPLSRSRKPWFVFAVRVSPRDCWQIESSELLAQVRKAKSS